MYQSRPRVVLPTCTSLSFVGGLRQLLEIAERFIVAGEDRNRRRACGPVPIRAWGPGPSARQAGSRSRAASFIKGRVSWGAV